MVFPVDSTRGFVVEGPTCQIVRPSTLESLRQLQSLLRLYDLAKKLPKSRKRKARTRKKDLPHHKRRRRVNWHEWVRELGPDDFYKHHRMRRATFEKLVRVLGDSLETDARKVRYGSGPVTPRIQLTMCLKFLGGDSNHDIKKRGDMYTYIRGGAGVTCDEWSTAHPEGRSTHPRSPRICRRHNWHPRKPPTHHASIVRVCSTSVCCQAHVFPTAFCLSLIHI